VRAAGFFQYATEIQGEKEGDISRAYLWVPPGAGKIRGMIIAGNVLLDPNRTSDPAIRAACTDAGLGIVYFSSHFAAKFEWEPTDAEDRLTSTLARLAELSRHPELADAGIRHPFDGKEPGPDSPITGNTQSGTPTRPGIFTFQVMVGKTSEIPGDARVYVLKIEP